VTFEKVVRKRLGLFLAVREALSAPMLASTSGDRSARFAELVTETVTGGARQDLLSKLDMERLDRVLPRIGEHLDHHDVLVLCTKILGLDRLAERVNFPDTSEEVYLRLAQGQPFDITSGGMYVQQQGPSRPRLIRRRRT
jgi:hypothetical protein